MSRFDTETAVNYTAEGAWEGRVSGRWQIGDTPNGGYLAAIALNALLRTIPHPDPITVNTHFLRPGVADADCLVEVEVIRSGRTLSTARATLSQEGKPRIVLLAAVADLDQPAGVNAALTLAAPDLPAPEACVPRTGEIQGLKLPILDRLDIRLDPALAVPGGSERAEMAGWIRFRDERPPDGRALVLFADAFPPSPLARLGVIGWVPTLELTVHVRRRPAPGWVQAGFRTDDLHDGRMIESGALWDSDGALVAQCRQIGLIRPRQ